MLVKSLLNMDEKDRSLTESEERLIEERLKSLGYL